MNCWCSFWGLHRSEQGLTFSAHVRVADVGRFLRVWAHLVSPDQGCVFSVGVGAWDSEFCAELSPGPSCGDELNGEGVSDGFESFDLCDDFGKGLVHVADSSTESLSFDNT